MTMKHVPINPKYRRIRITSEIQVLDATFDSAGRPVDVPIGKPGVIYDEWGEVLCEFRKTEVFPSTATGRDAAHAAVLVTDERSKTKRRKAHAKLEMYLAKSNPLDTEQAVREGADDCAEVIALLERRSSKYNYGDTARIKNYLKSLQVAGKFAQIEALFGQHPAVREMFGAVGIRGSGFGVESTPTPDYRNKAHGGPGRKRKK